MKHRSERSTVTRRLIAAVLLGATLTSIPAHADTSPPPAPQPEVTVTKSETTVAADATPAESGDVDSINLKYLREYLTDAGKIVTSPVNWDKKDFLKLGVVAGVTASLFLVDKNVRSFAQSHQSGAASKFAVVGNDLGNPLYTLPPLGAFYLYGYLADDHKARRTALLALESFALSGIMTEGLKTMVHRHRPNTGDSPTTFDGPKFSLKNVSFSSGHTASAFSMATIFAEEYKDNPYVPPLAYGLATLTGLSRVYSNEHWSSDVFLGGAIGYFTSKALLSYHKEDKNRILGNRLMILPQVGKEMTGLSVRYNF
jgi:membrane-associated phospholipid phosphatase